MTFSNDQKILILTTGGTMDKTHDPVREALVLDGKTRIPTILKTSRAHAFDYQQVLNMDSADMNDDHRAQIVRAIDEANDYQGIVITHGTSTMVQTAQFIDKNRAEDDKPVVLTGAFRPYDFANSDTEFNLGSAIAVARVLENGVRICMHGIVFDPYAVRKNVEAIRFEEEKNDQN